MHIDYAGGMKLVAHQRGHSVVTDQIEAHGGEDTAMTPTELFVAALATCPLVYLLEFAKRHEINVEGLTADADYALANNPRRVGSISLRIKMPEPVSDQYRVALQRAAEQCLVHNSLRIAPEVAITIE